MAQEGCTEMSNIEKVRALVLDVVEDLQQLIDLLPFSPELAVQR
jgi:hypothetical protein